MEYGACQRDGGARPRWAGRLRPQPGLVLAGGPLFTAVGEGGDASAGFNHTGAAASVAERTSVRLSQR